MENNYCAKQEVFLNKDMLTINEVKIASLIKMLGDVDRYMQKKQT